MFLVSGISIAMIELFLLFIVSYILRKRWKNLYTINTITYYWLMITIITFIWEFSYIVNYNDISEYAKYLTNTSTHVWKNKYNLSFVLPWEMATIFYAEYSAYADREYGSFTDDWSKTVESSHAIFCGLFSLFAIILKILNKENHYLIVISIAMGSQLMNSILYLVEYLVQMNDTKSVNYYNRSDFPAGRMLNKRPFMWINIFWILLPFYTMIYMLNSNNNKTIKQLNEKQLNEKQLNESCEITK